MHLLDPAGMHLPILSQEQHRFGEPLRLLRRVETEDVGLVLVAPDDRVGDRRGKEETHTEEQDDQREAGRVLDTADLPAPRQCGQRLRQFEKRTAGSSGQPEGLRYTD